MGHFILALFALAGGLTLSGIVANLYRLLAKRSRGRLATWIHYGVMLLAGPSVLFENSTKSFREKECSRWAYVFALSVTAYWSLMLGLIVLSASDAI